MLNDVSDVRSLTVVAASEEHEPEEHEPEEDEEEVKTKSMKSLNESTMGYSVVSMFQGDSSVFDEVRKFKSMCKKKTFEIKTDWSGAKIVEIKGTQLDMRIHSERIIGIVDRMIRKLVVVGCLPYYLKNDGEILRKYLPKEQADFIIKKLLMKRRSFESVMLKKSKYKSVALTPIGKNDYDLITPLDEELDHIIRFISGNKCLNLLQQKQKLRVKDKVHNIIVLVRRLMQLVSNRFSVTAETEHKRQKKLRDAFQEVKERMAIIQKLEEALLEKTHETDLKIRDKDITIKEYKSKIKRIRKQFKEEIEDVVQDSSLIMMKVDQHSGERLEILEEEAKIAEQVYNTQIEQHLIKEKKLRTRRFKIETQLMSWVNKYDQEIGDRQDQLESLEEGLDNERKECFELMCLFKEQEEIYKKYKLEKDYEEAKILAEKVKHFLQNLAARRIQRLWRAYRERKLAKKKAKKDKAKAKAAKKAEK